MEESTMPTQLNQTDIAYIAGLFDGEGSILIKQYWEKKRKYR